VTIPWNIIDKVLEGKRLKEYEVRILYRNYHALLRILGIEGDPTSSSSIILLGTQRTNLTMEQLSDICIVLRKMRNALKRLDDEYTDEFMIFEKKIILGNTYFDTAVEMNMQAETKNATEKRMERKIKKATFLMVNFLQG
jgi:hypothetical protein